MKLGAYSSIASTSELFLTFIGVFKILLISEILSCKSAVSRKFTGHVENKIYYRKEICNENLPPQNIINLKVRM
jgi:hypothetical protein